MTQRIYLAHDLYYIPSKKTFEAAKIDHELGIPPLADLFKLSEQLRVEYQNHPLLYEGNKYSWFWGLLAQREFARRFGVGMRLDKSRKAPNFKVTVFGSPEYVPLDCVARTTAPWEMHVNQTRITRATILVGAKPKGHSCEMELVGWTYTADLIAKSDVRTFPGSDGKKPSKSYAMKHDELRPMSELREMLKGEPQQSSLF